MTTKSGWCLSDQHIGSGAESTCPRPECPCECHTAVNDLLAALDEYGPQVAALIITTVFKENS